MTSGDLYVSGLSYAYRSARGKGGVAAVRDVSFHLRTGSAVALVGPNGAGKTTLSKLLNGILKPDRGSIFLGGQRISPHRHPGTIVAYAFQNPDDQVFSSTVRAELAFGPRNVGLQPEEVERNIRKAAELLKVDDLLDSHPLDLPFVLRKRVSIAAALAMARPWSVLDEPTLGQDNCFRKWLPEVFAEMRSEDRGIVVVSHDPEFAFSTCDYVILLERGQVEFHGTTEEYAERSRSGWAAAFASLAMRAGERIPALNGVASFTHLTSRLAQLSHGEENGRSG